MTIRTVDIVGYEGKYQVTDDGKILSLPNTSRKRVRELKPEIFGNKVLSYERVSLCTEGKITRYLVHRLVATAFIPNPENKPQVNHIDNNGLNNLYTNLEWVTHKENMTHSAKQGRQNECRALGIAVSAKKARQETLYQMRQLLGHRFIGINYIPKRCYVTFVCKYCGNTYSLRIDTPPVQRGGICRGCFIKMKR